MNFKNSIILNHLKKYIDSAVGKSYQEGILKTICNPQLFVYMRLIAFNLRLLEISCISNAVIKLNDIV